MIKHSHDLIKILAWYVFWGTNKTTETCQGKDSNWALPCYKSTMPLTHGSISYRSCPSFGWKHRNILKTCSVSFLVKGRRSYSVGFNNKANDILKAFCSFGQVKIHCKILVCSYLKFSLWWQHMILEFFWLQWRLFI